MSQNPATSRDPSVHRPTYRSWVLMRWRCRPGNKRYARRYSDRGISVCARWDSFTNFVKDMGLRPPQTTLDRIDNNASYSPDNCRWATAKQQAMNTCTNRYITYQGQTRTLVEWAAQSGLSPSTLWKRLDQQHWSLERALTTLPQNKRMLTYQAVTQPLHLWAKQLRLSAGTIHQRLRLGWSMERIVQTPGKIQARALPRMSYQGQTHTLARWAKITGISKSTLSRRLHQGWPIDQILTTPSSQRKSRPACSTPLERMRARIQKQLRMS